MFHKTENIYYHYYSYKPMTEIDLRVSGGRGDNPIFWNLPPYCCQLILAITTKKNFVIKTQDRILPQGTYDFLLQSNYFKLPLSAIAGTLSGKPF